MRQTYQEQLTEILYDVANFYSNRTNKFTLDGGDYEGVETAQAAINALNGEMIGEIPTDLNNYGGELRGLYVERADLRQQFGVEI